mgnify:CR=1 FL=1
MSARWTTAVLDPQITGGWAVARSPEGFLVDDNGALFPRDWLKRQDLDVLCEHGIGHFDGQPVFLLELRSAAAFSAACNGPCSVNDSVRCRCHCSVCADGPADAQWVQRGQKECRRRLSTSRRCAGQGGRGGASGLRKMRDMVMFRIWLCERQGPFCSGCRPSSRASRAHADCHQAVAGSDDLGAHSCQQTRRSMLISTQT